MSASGYAASACSLSRLPGEPFQVCSPIFHRPTWQWYLDTCDARCLGTRSAVGMKIRRYGERYTGTPSSKSKTTYGKFPRPSKASVVQSLTIEFRIRRCKNEHIISQIRKQSQTRDSRRSPLKHSTLPRGFCAPVANKAQLFPIYH